MTELQAHEVLVKPNGGGDPIAVSVDYCKKNSDSVVVIEANGHEEKLKELYVDNKMVNNEQLMNKANSNKIASTMSDAEKKKQIAAEKAAARKEATAKALAAES